MESTFPMLSITILPFTIEEFLDSRDQPFVAFIRLPAKVDVQVILLDGRPH